MSKIIKYNMRFVGSSGEEIFTPVEIGWNEVNEKIAKKESFDGNYVIEDIEEEIVEVPTILDKIEAQVAYTAMITGTLLEE